MGLMLHNEKAKEQLEKAQEAQRWMAVMFYVDDNNQIQHSMTMHDFKYADFPTTLKIFKRILDHEFYNKPIEEGPLPDAPFVRDLKRRNGHE